MLKLVAARNGRDGALTLHQDVDLYSSLFKDGDDVSLALRDGRRAWVQVARGSVQVNGEALEACDGVALSNETALRVTAKSDTEVLIFDMG